MPAEQVRERDLVLSPNEFVHILDETKGNINTYVGPNKASLGNTEKPVVFNEHSKKFLPSGLDEAIQQFRTAPEGWYVILKNPADRHPNSGKTESLIDLKVGRKINMPGPVSFPLWPGQMAKVVKGHQLRHNQYLIGRVYDDEAAKANWARAVVKAQSEISTKTDSSKDKADPPVAKLACALGIDAAKLTMGQLVVINGTDVSFFIPPTGIEIVPDDEGNYTRLAVTLERLEYCILLDEDGNKRFVKGPDVVFPKPTETFLRRKDEKGELTRKFRAVELNPQMGIYIKVIADYDDAVGSYKAGDEMFLTGNDIRIYYPRPEHAIMRYGDGYEIHYAVAIPPGEGRYLLNKTTSEIALVEGPKMLLPDPRNSVIVNRMLSGGLCQLMYPGNKEALDHNLKLAAQVGSAGDDVERMHRESQYSSRIYASSLPTESATAGGIVVPQATGQPGPANEAQMIRLSRRGIVADDFSRKTTFTPPRSITLNTKFQGAVMMNIWTGYAVQLNSRRGARRVVVGPDIIMLDYDEAPEVIKMSRGRPKGSKGIKEDVYLRVRNNKMGDIIKAETADLVEVSIELSLRMNFVGEDSNRWFEVEDYTKFVSDHVRSMIRNAIKKMGVQDFSKNPIDLIRDTILGKAEGGKRAGRMLEENNLHIYDVEVLDVIIGDKTIADLLRDAQHSVVKQTLIIAQQERQLEVERQSEDIRQEINKIRATTTMEKVRLEKKECEVKSELNLAQLNNSAAEMAVKLKTDQDQQDMIDIVFDRRLERDKRDKTHQLIVERERLNLVLDDVKAQSQAWVDRASALQPELVAALQASSDVQLLGKAYEHMAPLSVLGNKTVLDLIRGLVSGTKLEGLLPLKKDK
jgi:major vault protein